MIKEMVDVDSPIQILNLIDNDIMNKIMEEIYHARLKSKTTLNQKLSRC